MNQQGTGSDLWIGDILTALLGKWGQCPGRSQQGGNQGQAAGRSTLLSLYVLEAEGDEGC